MRKQSPPSPHAALGRALALAAIEQFSLADGWVVSAIEATCGWAVEQGHSPDNPDIMDALSLVVPTFTADHPRVAHLRVLLKVHPLGTWRDVRDVACGMINAIADERVEAALRAGGVA